MIEVEPGKWSKIAGAKCWQCPLQSCHFVPPYVPVDAIAIAVGESPGSTEVVKQKPFTGQAGRLLDEALIAAGVNPAQIARTNVVCCAPPHNIPLSKQAAQACQEALRAAIGTLPVVSCGAPPLEALRALGASLPDGGVTALRGQTHGRYHITVNPAYVLRNPGMLNTFMADIKAFFSADDNTERFDLNQITYDVIDNFDQLRSTLGWLTGHILAIDVETDDLIWYDKHDRPAAPLLCLAIADTPYHAYIIDSELVKLRPDLWNNFLNSVHLIAHNGKFDQEVLRRFGFDFKLSFDTMLAHYALNENKGTHKLEQVAAEYLGISDYKKSMIDDFFTSIKVPEKKRKYSLVPKDLLYQYAATDVCTTLELASILATELRKNNLHNWPFKQILMPLSEALVEVELEGIKIDKLQLEIVNAFFVYQLADLEAKMFDLIGYTFNPRSTPQVSKILYGDLGLKLTKRLLKPTKTNTGKEALEALPDHPFVNLLKEHRRIEKLRNTYVETLFELADVDDRVHINFNIHGTEIGRLSANDSQHGIPRAADIYGQCIRSLYIADEDNTLVIGDYQQAELRVFAANSQDANLLKAYRNGEDIHDQTAKMLENGGSYFFKGYSTASKEEKKRMRVVAKNCNFGGLCYQGGAVGISGMLGGRVPIAELQEILKFFRKTYPGAFEYAERQYQYLKTHGYVKTRFNRYRRFPLLTNDLEDEARKVAAHMVTASEAADLTNLSIVELTNYFKARGLNARVVHTMHDSIIIECEKLIAEPIAAMLKRVMEDMGNKYIPEVPWIAEVEVSDRWEPIPNLEALNGDT